MAKNQLLKNEVAEQEKHDEFHPLGWATIRTDAEADLTKFERNLQLELLGMRIEFRELQNDIAAYIKQLKRLDRVIEKVKRRKLQTAIT